MYHVYEHNMRITDNPISLNWLYNIFATIYLPNIIPFMKPGEVVAVQEYKIVKVD